MDPRSLIGSLAPPFKLFDQDMNRVSLEDLQNRKALVVFIPLPFTNTCLGEMCQLRDELSALNDIEATVVAITTHAVPTNKQWSEEHQFGFPVLSDFWPHGRTSIAYGTFDEKLGIAHRNTYVLDKEGVIREVISSPHLGTAREYDRYVETLSSIA